jgi:ribonuclease HII
MQVRRACWRVVHAPVEVASIVADVVSDTITRAANALYDKGYPEDGGTYGDTIHIETSSNRQGVENTVDRNMYVHLKFKGGQLAERESRGHVIGGDIDGPLYGPDGPVNW